MEQDSPVHRADISELSSDQLETLIEEIRERRIKPVRDYEKAQQLLKEKKDAELAEDLEKQLGMFSKELERVDRTLSALEKRSKKIRELRMLLEMEE